MNEKLLGSLEKLAHTAKTSSDAAGFEKAVKETRELIKQSLSGAGDAAKKLLSQLDSELDVWQKKITVIVKEPLGRQGMAKHAHHWAEILKKAS